LLDPYGNVVFRGSEYNTETGDINLNEQGFYSPNKRSATIAHELAHSFDDLAEQYGEEKESILGPSREKEEAIQRMLKLKPEYSKILNDPSFHKKEKSTQEGGATNRPAPNFQDYDFASGKFKSFIKKLPSSIQEELATEHHGRNYPLEGIKALSKGGFDKLVEASPKFKKLRSLIS
jgi:phage pi2 protein 07